METELTFIEFLKIVLSFYPYILSSVGIVLFFWIVVGYIQVNTEKKYYYREPFQDRFL